MRVLILTDYFLPHACGGIERAAYEVSSRIASEGHDVTVLTFRRGDSAAEEDMDGLRVVRVPALDVSGLIGVQLSASAHVWPKVRELIRDRRIDLIHTHGLFFHVSLAAAVMSRRTGTPLITTAHVGSLDSIGGAASRLSGLYEQSVGRFILNSSRQVIAVSQAVADHIQGLGATMDHVTVVPNGVDLEHYAPSPGRRRGKRPPRMIFVGRLIANKGPQYLIEALPRVLSHHPEAECWLVGDGPLRHDLERTIREQHLQDNVRFLGERDDVASLLGQSDVFVRPSLSEGLPLAVLEAMAACLPVVVAPVGGTPELVEDGKTGFLVTPGDRQGLEDHLCQLLADGKLRRAMGMRANRAAAAYDWDVISRETLAIYERALGSEKRRISYLKAA